MKHRAFDAGLFALTPNYAYAVLVSPVVQRAPMGSHKFKILSLNGKPIHKPARENVMPHPEAMEWHRVNVFRA